MSEDIKKKSNEKESNKEQSDNKNENKVELKTQDSKSKTNISSKNQNVINMVSKTRSIETQNQKKDTEQKKPKFQLDKTKTLQYYSRDKIKEAISIHAKDKEIAIRYGDFFGKRPDVIMYPNDINEAAKKNATSFHNSEERWSNPLQLNTGMKRKEQDELRIGWDFILDIDCPIWEYSKIITSLLIKALKKHKVKTISVKFSGNKGFHIGVPFETFPKKFQGKETRTLFPEAPKRIAQYLIDYINGPETNYELSNLILESKSVNEIAKISGKSVEELTKNICLHCKTLIKKEEKKDLIEFICPVCEKREKVNEASNYRRCEKCNIFMEKQVLQTKEMKCEKCDSTEFIAQFDPSPILEVDTLLISSRHMYRMPFSLHEKSGLTSLPFNPDKVMLFERKYAEPDKIKEMRYQFLDVTNTQPNEALELLEKAWNYIEIIERSKTLEKEMKTGYSENKNYTRELQRMEEEIPIEHFPPCIKNILNGLEDGKKRALFILGNFLSCTGYDWKKIREIVDDWNKKNEDSVRETIVNGHLRYHEKLNRLMLPPNCQAKTYYADLGVCKPDNLCAKIKNPVQYSKRKVFYLNNNKPKKRGRKKKEEEGKANTKENLNPKMSGK